MALTAVQKVSLVGLVLSAYAVYVEHSYQADPTNYSALVGSPHARLQRWPCLVVLMVGVQCDLSKWLPNVSCSKVFSSEYGRILSYMGFVEKGSDFDQPNAVLGASAAATWPFRVDGNQGRSRAVASSPACLRVVGCIIYVLAVWCAGVVRLDADAGGCAGAVYYFCAFLSDVLTFIPGRKKMMFVMSVFTSVRFLRACVAPK